MSYLLHKGQSVHLFKVSVFPLSSPPCNKCRGYVIIGPLRITGLADCDDCIKAHRTFVSASAPSNELLKRTVAETKWHFVGRQRRQLARGERGAMDLTGLVKGQRSLCLIHELGFLHQQRRVGF